MTHPQPQQSGASEGHVQIQGVDLALAFPDEFNLSTG